MARIDREELRLLVREALRDALGSGPKPAGATATASATARPKTSDLAEALRKAVAEGRRAEIDVAVRSRDDLDRFARDIAEAAAEPGIKAAILGGRVGFVPVGGAAAATPSTARPAAPGPGPGGGTFEMKTGVLTETKVVEIARSHRKIVLAAEVVLTPLARDKAREMRLELARLKP